MYEHSSYTLTDIWIPSRNKMQSPTLLSICCMMYSSHFNSISCFRCVKMFSYTSQWHLISDLSDILVLCLLIVVEKLLPFLHNKFNGIT